MKQRESEEFRGKTVAKSTEILSELRHMRELMKDDLCLPRPHNRTNFGLNATFWLTHSAGQDNSNGKLQNRMRRRENVEFLRRFNALQFQAEKMQKKINK